MGEEVDLAREWLIKAEHDLTAAKVLAKSPERVLDAAIYHCQQAGRKGFESSLGVEAVPPREDA